MQNELAALKNHIIRISQRSQELYNYIRPLADGNYTTQSGIIFTDAKVSANNLRSYAAQLINAIQTDQPNERLVEILNKIYYEYKNISNKYLKDDWVNRYNYRPMKEIRESIIFIDNLLKRVNFKNG